MIRLPGTTGTGRTGGVTCGALVSLSGANCSGRGCEKKALMPWPVEDFKLLVSSSSSMGGRLLAMDDFLHNGHVSLCSFMFRLIYDQRNLVPRRLGEAD